MILDRSDESNNIVFRKIISFLLGILIIGFFIVLYILQNISGVNEKLELLKLEKERVMLEKEQKELKVSLEFLTSPDNLEKIATGKFNMKPMEGDKVYIIELKK